ncbi:hypothetical protein V2J09_023177 [Rumex salicifolius]
MGMDEGRVQVWIRILNSILTIIKRGGKMNRKIQGTIVLKKKTKNVLDILDGLYELIGIGVSIQLISAVQPDPGLFFLYSDVGSRGKMGKITSLTPKESESSVIFEWDESMGFPGAIRVKNHHHSQLYLKSVTLEEVPGHEKVHFVCNSWVYPTRRYKYDRIFFANKSYLPRDTPELLVKYREEELRNLRGNGEGMLKEWDRVYDYAYYNDLGKPDKGEDYVRPVLGGSKEYPYPRRGRTGRKPTKTDPNTESRLPILNLDIYVPRDERFDEIKFSDFVAEGLKSIAQILVPKLKSIFENTHNEFDSFEDVQKLYEGGFKLPSTINKVLGNVPCEILKVMCHTEDEGLFKFPMPDVIKEDKTAWRTDEEFAREMLAGLNPLVIRCLQEFPPTSKLDPSIYGNHNSIVTTQHIESNMDGLTVDEAIGSNRLFILDHHDSIMPYLIRINSTTTKMYATRTILFLKEDGTLRPLAIELSLAHPQGYNHGVISQVYTPSENGVEGSVWQLAKAYVAVNDSGYHQLIMIEPFVIASNRQLSILHPIYKLLHPHFRDTMHVNALARHLLISAGGFLEETVFPAKYAMEMSSFIYKDWVFTDQALPSDLIKRGMAVRDDESPHGLRLLIEDYPFAVDGLAIWSAIEAWVNAYCSFYYTSDDMVSGDVELQRWWTEIRNEGHGDKKDEPWWPEMKTRQDLTTTCTIIIWVASALHAAVNFGQYSYAGYLPNRPTISRQFMPEPGTTAYAELEADPDKHFLRTITALLQTLLGVALIEQLSTHFTNELYLGQRDTLEWTSDVRPLVAFKEFGSSLIEIESRITERNNNGRLNNRLGPVKMPYTLLYPSTSDYSKAGGLTGKGIPNSVSV